MSIKPHLQHKARSDVEFLGWLRFARPGERCVYHIGWLMEDRHNNEELDRLAWEAWEAHERGQVFLMQQRVPGTHKAFVYLAIKRRRD